MAEGGELSPLAKAIHNRYLMVKRGDRVSTGGDDLFELLLVGGINDVADR